MKMSDSITNLATALAKAQAEIRPAIFDSTNPHFRSKYASLTAVMEACREALSKNQIAVVQGAAVVDGAVAVTTLLLHASGEYISDELTMQFAQATPQQIGSSLSYCRRYSLASLVGITADDDDAEEAMPKPNSGEPAKDVKITPIKETDSQTRQSSNSQEVQTTNKTEATKSKESKVKRATIRATKIKEIFEKSTELGMNLSQLKAFISEITGKSIAESADLSDADLPFILEELKKLQVAERKVA